MEKARDGKPIDNDNVICRTCYRPVLAKNSNTSNLLAHLKANHGKVYSEATEAMKSKPSRRPSIGSKGTSTAVPSIGSTCKGTSTAVPSIGSTCKGKPSRRPSIGSKGTGTAVPSIGSKGTAEG